MIIPGSTYWNLGYGLDKGDVAKDEEGLRNMTDLGETIAWLGQAISRGDKGQKQAAVSEPLPETAG
jgi:hypothetical protein